MERNKLEDKFRCYQQILAESVISRDGKIDLDEIAQDYCVMGAQGEMYIRYIATEGDYVYMTLDLSVITGKDDAKNADVKYWISDIGDKQFAYLVELMRKAMIIQELRNTYTHE